MPVNTSQIPVITLKNVKTGDKYIVNHKGHEKYLEDGEYKIDDAPDPAPEEDEAIWTDENQPTVDEIAKMKEPELLKIIDDLNLDLDLESMKRISEKREAVVDYLYGE